MISKTALFISVIVDLGMVVLSCFAIEMCVDADPEGNCHKLVTLGYVYAITAVSIVRCFHIFLILLLLCAAPCFMFSNKCCLKRRLVRRQAAPSHTIKQLRENWSWTQGRDKIPIKEANCMLCLSHFHAGENVTFVPC